MSSTALVLAACNPVQVRTMTSPGADIGSRPTFRLMRAPAQRGNVRLSSNDPMLVNSITYRRIRESIRHDLEQRGYRYSESGAAMDVAYYATAQQKLDIRSWDYGYGWRRFGPQRTAVSEYEEGTVIVDVVDPATHELLWRGQGRADVSDDPNSYASQLEKTVQKIIGKLPARSR